MRCRECKKRIIDDQYGHVIRIQPSGQKYVMLVCQNCLKIHQENKKNYEIIYKQLTLF